MDVDRQTDAILAQGLLNSLAVISGAAGLLCDEGHPVPPPEADNLTEMISRQAGVFIEGLQLLVRYASDSFADATTAISLAASMAARVEREQRPAILQALIDRTELIRQVLQGVTRGLPKDVIDLIERRPSPPPAD